MEGNLCFGDGGSRDADFDRLRMMGWYASLGCGYLTLPDRPGWCYLRFFKEDARPRLSRLLGPFPFFRSVFSADYDDFLPAVELQNLVVSVDGGVAHVGGTGERSISFSFFFRSAVSLFRYSYSSGYEFLKRSFEREESWVSDADLDVDNLVLGADTDFIDFVKCRSDLVGSVLEAFCLAYVASKGGVSSGPPVCSPVAGMLGVARGPNFERNHANRLRKREVALQRKSEHLQGVEKRVIRSGVGRTGEEQTLHDLRVERQIIQERRRLDKLKSPAQMIEDAMKQIVIAERCAKMANDSRVAAWAADLSSASAESIARSAGADIRTVSSGSVAKQVSGVAPVGRGAAVVPSVVVTAGDTRGTVKPELGGFSLEQLTSGISDHGSVSSSGVLYTKLTAAKWVKSYSYLEKYAGRSEQQVAKLGSVSVGEVKKYYRLKAEFGL